MMTVQAKGQIDKKIISENYLKNNGPEYIVATMGAYFGMSYDVNLVIGDEPSSNDRKLANANGEKVRVRNEADLLNRLHALRYEYINTLGNSTTGTKFYSMVFKRSKQ